MAFDYAYIGYDNHATAPATAISGTGVSTGFSAASAGNWQAFDFVQFDAGACTLVFDFGSSKAIDYIAIAGHTLFTTNADDIVVEVDDLSDFSTATELVNLTLDTAGQPPIYSGSYRLDTSTTIAATTILDDPIMCFALDAISKRYMRISFTAADTCKIGVVAAGQRMTFERGFFGGFMPPAWNEEVDATNNKSESGVYLGRSIVRSGLKPFDIDLSPVTADWINATWQPFRRHADLLPFIFKWGFDPLSDNVLALQKAWKASELRNRVAVNGKVWASVGISCEGVNK